MNVVVNPVIEAGKVAEDLKKGLKSFQSIVDFTVTSVVTYINGNNNVIVILKGDGVEAKVAQHVMLQMLEASGTLPEGDVKVEESLFKGMRFKREKKESQYPVSLISIGEEVEKGKKGKKATA